MRIGFVGSRQFRDEALVARVVSRLHQIHGNYGFVSGGAKGADTLSQNAYFQFMRDHLSPDEMMGHIKVHYPDSQDAYEAFGKDFRARAFGRNKWIVDDADILVCFYSTPEPKGGTLNTHNHARRKGIPIYYFCPGKGWRKENV